MQRTSKENPITFEASFSGDSAEVTVIVNRYAGVCGPSGVYAAETIDAAEAALFAAGYLVTSEWTAAKYGDSLYADMVRIA